MAARHHLSPDVFGAPLTKQPGLGWIMAPVQWPMGILWSQPVTTGGLDALGACLQLAALPPTRSIRSRLIMLYQWMLPADGSEAACLLTAS